MNDVSSLSQTDAVLAWLARSFEAMTYWKEMGRTIFWECGCNDAQALKDMQVKLKNYFASGEAVAEDILYWAEDGLEKETRRVEPPQLDINEVDWEFAADYVLLACGTPFDRVEEENTRRSGENQKAEYDHQKQQSVFTAYQFLLDDPAMADETLVEELKSRGCQSTKVVIAAARKAVKGKDKMAEPSSAEPLAMLQLYRSKRFK